MDKKISALQYVYLFTPSVMLSFFGFFNFGMYGAISGFIGGFLYFWVEAIMRDASRKETEQKAAREKAEEDRLIKRIVEEIK